MDTLSIKDSLELSEVHYMSLKKHEVVVVGNGMVSVRFCEQLLEYDRNGRSR